MKHTGHHRHATQAPGAETFPSCPVVTGLRHDHLDTSTNRAESETGAKAQAGTGKGASRLVADLHQWLALHDVHPDVLETFMEQVVTALTFQEIVGTHPVHIDSPLGALARRDLARIVVNDITRQRQR